MDIGLLLSIIAAILTFVSIVLMTLAAAAYKRMRQSTGNIGFRNVGWFLLLIGVVFQVILQTQDDNNVAKKAASNIICLMLLGLASLCIMIHALAARAI